MIRDTGKNIYNDEAVRKESTRLRRLRALSYSRILRRKPNGGKNNG